MIKAKDAISVARSLIGTPYSELDCINLIKKVIRTAPGGVANYTTAGTNTLWRSYDASPKYKDLTERHNTLAGIPAGALPFKASGLDFHHVGIATGEGTVIHSSSAYGGRGVVETPLTEAEGWNCWGVHRYIETEEGETVDVLYKAKVITLEDPLTLRNAPRGDKIGKLPIGAIVDVLVEADDDWLFVRYGRDSGYASKQYLRKVEGAEAAEKRMFLTDSAGNVWEPVGNFSVELKAVED